MSGRAADKVRATPLRGGRQNSGVCILLEVGGARLLLDSGWENGACDPSDVIQLANELVTAGGVDAVLLSHPDFHHVGALPIVLGRQGMSNVPVICTSPVSKFSQMLLYEFVLNQKMEARAPSFDLDDIDLAFSHVTNVKYNQRTTIPDTRGVGDSEYRQVVTVTAIPSGRTIGGTIWRINCGPAEVLYSMDINLKRDIVIDAASLEQLPASPALMITEAGCVSRGMGVGLKGRRAREDTTATFLQAIVETVRSGGNVLIPCENAGRILEILQILAKYWVDNKMGMDHLLYLSHMGHNVMELARSNLEWMSDSLNRDFYNGKANPFELPIVKVISTTTALEKRYPGPKVVLATEMSLNYGFSKELLLKWGGDPRSRVIYFDRPDQGSLISIIQDLMNKPPIIVNLTRPVRIPLVGQELADFRAEEERKRKEYEEEMLRQKRQRELAEFQVVQMDTVEEEDENLSGNKRPNSSTAAPNFRDIVSKRLRTSAISKYLNSNFVMFESKLPVIVKMDEYGMSNDDLVFRDIQSTESRYAIRDRSHVKQRLAHQQGGNSAGDDAAGDHHGDGHGASGQANNRDNHSASSAGQAGQVLALPPPKSNPTKLIAIDERIQFTCEFKEFGLGGRLDFKAMRALVQKVAPVRLLVVRGSDSDCDELVKFAESSHIEAYAPMNRRSVAFEVFTERLKLQIPRTLVPANLQVVRPAGITTGSTLTSSSTSAGSASDTAAHCTICVLKGEVSITEVGGTSVNQEGSRIVKYLGAKDAPKKGNNADETTDEDNDDDDTKAVTGLLPTDEATVGVVSLGEVTLGQLKQLLDSANIKTEFNLAKSGGCLVCAEQVIIRKDNNNFSIEGPPVRAFFEARRVLYSQFAFL